MRSIVLVLFLAVPLFAGDALVTNRPSNWAQPVELKGVPNLHRVTENLYRSAQPDAEGMRNLKKLGIKTVVNLRSFHSDRGELAGTGLAYKHIYAKTWHAEEEDLVEFFKIMADTGNVPVLVHCQHGADRTGSMVALYRVVAQGWSKEDALKEMVDGGYGFHTIWKNLIAWVESMNIERVRKASGLKRLPAITAEGKGAGQ